MSLFSFDIAPRKTPRTITSTPTRDIEIIYPAVIVIHPGITKRNGDIANIENKKGEIPSTAAIMSDVQKFAFVNMVSFNSVTISFSYSLISLVLSALSVRYAIQKPETPIEIEAPIPKKRRVFTSVDLMMREAIIIPKAVKAPSKPFMTKYRRKIFSPPTIDKFTLSLSRIFNCYVPNSIY